MANKTSGISISVTDDERERINRLCELENRPRKAQIMHMVDEWLAEHDKKSGD